MSRIKDYLINEMDRKFGECYPENLNVPCSDCGKEYWKHTDHITCPTGNEMDEPED